MAVAGFGSVGAPSELIGRDAELARLRSRLARAADGGAGGMVLVTGQPGVGKSALLGAVRAHAAATGWLALAGRGLEAERGLGYAPVVEAFGPDLRRLGPKRAAALAHGLPQLGRLFSGVPGKTAPLGDGAVERMGLVDAIARLCERVTATTPLLLALDDLHWADAATLELAHHLLRRLEGDRFLLVATARDVVDQRSAAEYLAFLDSTRRLLLADEIELLPLRRPEVAALLATLLPGPQPAPELVRVVEQRAGGLPLFVAAVARALADADALVVLDGQWTVAEPGAAREAPLPAGLRAVLDARLAQLDPHDRPLLDLLAVHAAPLAHGVLTAAADRGERAVEEGLARLVAAGVATEETTDGVVRYAVAHALLGEAAAAGMPAAARQRLHLALADAVERVAPESVEALARHLRGAGERVPGARLVPALLAAAEHAGRRSDHQAAADALGEIVGRLRREPSVAVRPPLEHWAEALYRAGRVTEAAGVWRECLAGREPAGIDPALHHRLAAAERDLGRLDAAAAHLDEAARCCAAAADPATTDPATADPATTGPTAAGPTATDSTATIDPGALQADVLADRFALAERVGDRSAAQYALDALHRLAEHTGADSAGLAAATARAGWERSRDNLAAAAAAADEALAAARRIGSALAELRALAAVLEVAVDAGAAEAIRAHADRALGLAARWGAPAVELRAIGSRVAAGVHDGDWPGMDRDIARCLALSRRFDAPRSVATVLSVRCLVQVFRGELAAAESTIAEAQRYAAAVAGDRYVEGDLALARSQLALARGDRTRLAALVPILRRTGGRNLTWRLLTAAQSLVLLGRRDELPELAEQLAAGTPDAYRQAVIDWIAGLAGPGDAPELLRGAADVLAAQRRPYWAALARLDLAECLAGTDPTAGRAQAEQALEVLDGLGGRRAADRARLLLRRLGAQPRPARRRVAGGGLLSARELEVARMFAEGLTTAEVAGRLVLSPHTVTAHLRRIYDRLEVRSRASLTRVLAERGLLGPAPDQPPD